MNIRMITRQACAWERKVTFPQCSASQVRLIRSRLVFSLTLDIYHLVQFVANSDQLR